MVNTIIDGEMLNAHFFVDRKTKNLITSAIKIIQLSMELLVRKITIFTLVHSLPFIDVFTP